MRFMNETPESGADELAWVDATLVGLLEMRSRLLGGKWHAVVDGDGMTWATRTCFSCHQHKLTLTLHQHEGLKEPLPQSQRSSADFAPFCAECFGTMKRQAKEAAPCAS